MKQIGIAYNILDDEIHPVYFVDSGILIDESFDNIELKKCGRFLEILNDNTIQEIATDNISKLDIRKGLSYDLINKASRKLGKQIDILIESKKGEIIGLILFTDSLNIINFGKEINDSSSIEVLKINVEYIEEDEFEYE